MLLAEVQMTYIMQMITHMATERIVAVEPKQARFDAYNEAVDATHETLIWRHTGVSTYYRNQRGRVVVNSPWTVQGYWQRLREADLDDYAITPAADRSMMSPR
jgi:4-hydroxyacetophenone monooxygenase